MKSVLILLFICLNLSVSAQNSPLEYIEKYKNVAIQHMNEQGRKGLVAAVAVVAPDTRAIVVGGFVGFDDAVRFRRAFDAACVPQLVEVAVVVVVQPVAAHLE